MNNKITKKSVLGTIILLNLFTINILAQSWTKMSQSPDITNSEFKSAVAFTIDGIGYLVGGISRFHSDKSALNYYSVGGDDWMPMSIDFEAGIRYEAVGFGINGKGYVIGGKDENGNYKNDVWELDPIAYTWTKKADFPGGARASAVAFVIGNKAYIGTGNNGTTYFNDLYEYTPATDSWVIKTNFPGAARQDAIAFAVESKGYIGTGLNASGVVLNDFWEYDPSLNTWTSKANFPGNARTSAVGMGYAKKGFVGTGNNGAVDYKDFWEYTASTNTWEQLTTDFPSVARHEAASFVSGAKLCVFEGQNSAGTIIKDSYYFKHKYNYGFTITPDKICFGETVVIKNITNDPDAYKYRFDAPTNPTGFTREDTLTDTIHYTPSGPNMNLYIYMHVNDKSGGPYGDLASATQLLKVSQIDQAYLTTVPDTCTGTVGRAEAEAYLDGRSLAPYSFKWSTGVTNTSTVKDEIINLTPGPISVIITDAAGCTITKSGTIGSYIDKPVVSIVSIPDTCVGKVGEIRVYPQTNRLPFTYNWSNSKTTAFISNLDPGKYKVEIKDKNNCVLKDSATVALHLDTVKLAITSVDASCSTANGSLTVAPSKGTNPYVFNWSTNEHTATINSLTAGPYSITVLDKYGCTTSAPALVKTTTIATVPSICMVTVDSTSKYNVINWEKTNYVNVDSFIVYREINTNSYKRIGAVPYSALSSFVDKERIKYAPNTGDPNAGTYRYKLQIRDACGYYSALSNYHNTIFIINNNGTFTWPQLYTIEGGGNPVNSYVLMRDDNSNGNWNAVNSVSGTQQIVIDPAYNAFKNTASYRVQTAWGITCTPTFKGDEEQRVNNFTTSFSNKQGRIIITNVNAIDQSNVSISIYPNPFNTEANLEISGLTNSSIVELKLFDYLGKEVKSQQLENGTQKLDRGNLVSGMYFLEISQQGKLLGKKKIIIND